LKYQQTKKQKTPEKQIENNISTKIKKEIIQSLKLKCKSKQCKNPRVCGTFIMDMKAIECPCCGYPMPNLN
jgi:TATA-binding protein-associated factor Taf7